MLFALSIVYGIHIILITYGLAFVAVRGCLGSGSMPFYITTLKYLIYFLILRFGFKNLDSSGIVIGIVAAVYLSLPLMYWVNKWVVRRSEETGQIPS